MRVGDKAEVIQGKYVGQMVRLHAPYPRQEGFWYCAVPVLKYDKGTGTIRETAAALEVLLSEQQLRRLA